MGVLYNNMDSYSGALMVENNVMQYLPGYKQADTAIDAAKMFYWDNKNDFEEIFEIHVWKHTDVATVFKTSQM